MSRMRTLGLGVLAATVLFGAAACSKSDGGTKKSDRAPISFADPPKGSMDIGICYAYNTEQIKDLIGGKETFKRLAPAAIGTAKDKVHGEACGWQRTEPNGDSVNLRVEIRDFGEDQAALLTQYDALKKGATDVTDVAGLGEGAFSAVSDDTSLLEVKSGPYLLTLTSHAEGSLKPVDLAALQLLAASGLDRIT
ncbi:MAG TPA: hypothetical protein VNQ33_00580 [Acidimicrobiales bacterium]|nr:hypothetical protein [Acidimicrobiales bacterium]